MDPIEIQYENMTLVPEAFRGLYSEVNGKAVLSNVNGIKTQNDVDTVKEALRKERENHATTQNLLKPWNGMNAAEVSAKMLRFDELEAAAGKGIDEEKIEQIVTNRLKMKTGPLETQITEFSTSLKNKDEEINTLRNTLSDITVKDIVRNAAVKSKVHSTAIQDVEFAAKAMMTFDEQGKLVTRDGLQGITAGMDIDGFLKTMFKQRPHWWPESEGGGSRGGNGGGFNNKNPWSKENWSMTEQGRYLQENGRDSAERLAKSAGSFVGATAPKK